MNPDTRKFTVSLTLDECVSSLTRAGKMHLKTPKVNSDTRHLAWLIKLVKSLKRLQKSSVLVREEILSSGESVYYYEVPSRELTYLTLVDPDLLTDLRNGLNWREVSNI